MKPFGVLQGQQEHLNLTSQVFSFIPHVNNSNHSQKHPLLRTCYSMSTNAVTFDDLLQRCEDWKAVEVLWNSQEGDIESSYPLLVLTYLKRLRCYPEGYFLGQVLTTLKLHVPHVKPRHIVACISTCAKMNFTDVGIVNDILREFRQHGLHLQLNHSGISSLCHSLGLMEAATARGSIPLCRPIFLDLADHIVDSLDNHTLNEWEVANLIHGLGRLQFIHDKIKLGLKRLLGSKQVDEFTSHGLIVVFYGLGQLHFDDKDALTKLIEVLIKPVNLWHYNEVAISTLLFTFAYLNYKTDKYLKLILEEAVNPKRLEKCSTRTLGTMCYSIRKLECTEEHILKPLGEELCQPNRLADFSDEALCNVVCGFSQLGYKDQQFWNCTACAVLNRGMERFSTSGITALLCGFLTAGTKHDALYEALCLEATVAKRLKFCRQHHLTSLLFSLSLIKNRSQRCVTLLLDEIAVRIGSLSNDSIKAIFISLSVLRPKAIEQQSVLAREATNQDRLRSASNEYLARIVYSLGNLELTVPRDQLTENLVSEISKEPRISSFTVRELSSIIYGLGEMRCKRDLVSLILSELFNRSIQECDTDSLSNVVYGLGRMSYPRNAQIKILTDEVLRPERICELGTSRLTAALMGLAQLRSWEAQENALQPLLDLIRQNANDLSETDISKVLYSLSCLKNPDRQLIDSLMDLVSSAERLGSCDERTLSTLIYCLGKLKFKNKMVWEHLSKEALQEERLSRYTDEGLSNMFWGINQIRNQGGKLAMPLVKQLILPSRLRSAKEHTLVVSLEGMALMKVMQDSSWIFMHLCKDPQMQILMGIPIVPSIGHL